MAGSADKATDALKRLGQQRVGGSGSIEAMKAAGMSDSEIQSALSDKMTSPEEAAAGVVKRPGVTQTIDYRKIAAQRGFVGEAGEQFAKAMDETLAANMAAMQNKLRGGTAMGGAAGRRQL